MSHPKYPQLFSPLDINNMQIPNRTVLTAMVTRLSGEDGYVNQDISDRYVRFARGEPGLIVVEATAVHQAKSGQLLRLSDDQFIPGHRDMLARVRDNSPSRIALQIIHFLKIARSGWRQTIDMLSKDDIQAIITAYGAASARVRECGYNAVELHMAHAYTLSSFLSARNKRLDEYGGRSLEGRMRLMSEVIGEVRRNVGTEFPIGVRFDGEEAIKGGYGLSESKYMALRMAQLGVDYISISAGGKFEDAIKKEGEPLYPYTGYSGDRTMPPAQYQDGANVYLAAAIKEFVNAHGYATPIVTTGKIILPGQAEGILAAGEADLVGFARALLADPDWPKKARDGREAQIIRCIYGNVCKNLDENFKKVVCGSLWPRGILNAPEAPDDHESPQWPTDGKLKAQLRDNGQLRLTWEKANDPQGIYGYEIFRSVNNGPFAHLTTSKTASHVEEYALAGNSYSYYVRAYDFAGNRGPDSNQTKVEIPADFVVPEGKQIALDGDVEAEMGFSA